MRFLSAIRTIRRLMKQIGLQTNGEKQCNMIRFYANYAGYKIDHIPKAKLRDWLVDLWISGEDKLIKRHEPSNFYLTNEWRSLREVVLLHYGAICMKCCSKTHIHVDHIKPRSIYPELELHFENMQVLCRSCNSSKSNKSIKDYRIKNKQNN